MSAKRFYPVRQVPTTEAGITTLWLSQIYVSLGDSGKDGSVVVRIWWKPLVTLIWLGGLVMMAGGGGVAARPPAARRRAGRAAGSCRGQAGERPPHERRAPGGADRAAAVARTGGPALAVLPDEVLSDPALEARARALSAELRCMVCQNQSIDDSNADLAHDLRVLVRERIEAGDSDEEVIDYIVSRYGEFVLLKPRFNLRNALLWTTPVVLLLAGGVFILRRRAGAGGSRRRRCRQTRSRRWTRSCAAIE